MKIQRILLSISLLISVAINFCLLNELTEAGTLMGKAALALEDATQRIQAYDEALEDAWLQVSHNETEIASWKLKYESLKLSNAP